MVFEDIKVKTGNIYNCVSVWAMFEVLCCLTCYLSTVGTTVLRYFGLLLLSFDS